MAGQAWRRADDCGTLNTIMITRLKIVAFIATLAIPVLDIVFGLWLTDTRAMNMPAEITQWGVAPFGWSPAAGLGHAQQDSCSSGPSATDKNRLRQAYVCRR